MTNVPKAVEHQIAGGTLKDMVRELKAENARLSLENQSLREKIVAAGYSPNHDAEEIKEVELWLKARAKQNVGEIARLNGELAEYRDIVTHWQGENERLTAALVECQEAFESGREVGAVVGELEY